MTPSTQRIVSIALDEALAGHVVKLYGVLMADGDSNGLARFWTGLNRTIGIHEELKSTIEADNACIDSASSGS